MKVALLTEIKSNDIFPIESAEDLSKLNGLIFREAPRFESTASTNNPELDHGFPIILCHLENLKILDLSGHNISQVPNNIESLKNLNELILIGCSYLEEVSEKVALLPING